MGIKTRFMILSDTHGFNFTRASGGSTSKFPLPSVDVVLHCGDLSMSGSRSHYRETVKMLKRIDAELKLVIAGNHDTSLDKSYWRTSKDEYEAAMSFWRHVHETDDADARDQSIVYLEEGMHRFTLESGATFSIYASPMTPAYLDWAFNYTRSRNPWDRIPNGVDVVMTHGPPSACLGFTRHHDNAGCRKLTDAIERTKPRLHCFGHIHEGRGATSAQWVGFDRTENGVVIQDVAADGSVALLNGKTASADITRIAKGESTLFINAAVMNVRREPINPPWIVDMELDEVG